MLFLIALIIALLFAAFLQRFRILVEPFMNVFGAPGLQLFIFLLIVDTEGHAADDFHFVHGFHPHSQVVLDEL